MHGAAGTRHALLPVVRTRAKLVERVRDAANDTAAVVVVVVAEDVLG